MTLKQTTTDIKAALEQAREGGLLPTGLHLTRPQVSSILCAEKDDLERAGISVRWLAPLYNLGAPFLLSQELFGVRVKEVTADEFKVT